MDQGSGQGHNLAALLLIFVYSIFTCLFACASDGGGPTLLLWSEERACFRVFGKLSAANIDEEEAAKYSPSTKRCM